MLEEYVRHRRVLDHRCLLKSTAPPADQARASPSGTASARFVGHWQRHVSTLDITATTATLFAGLDMGPCSQGQAACSETDTLGVVSGDDTQLTVAVTAVSYGLKNGQTTSGQPQPGSVDGRG